jgi:hypothetical protein
MWCLISSSQIQLKTWSPCKKCIKLPKIRLFMTSKSYMDIQTSYRSNPFATKIPPFSNINTTFSGTQQSNNQSQIELNQPMNNFPIVTTCVVCNSDQ